MERKRNFSCKRQAILHAIRDTKTHPTAEWVYEKLKPIFPNLSLGTVYRNIAQFKEDGEVVSVGVVGGFDRIDGNTRPHPHFVCKQCHAVLDLDAEDSGAALDRRVSEQYGVACDHHDIVFYGTCGHCLKSQQHS